MTLKDYEKCALRTAKKKERLLTPQEYEMLECSCGLAGEGGELVDMVKKYIFHGHEFDVSKAMKELGDIHWYWSVMCATLQLDPDDVLAANVEKLRKRYPNGFSTEDSIARRDQTIFCPRCNGTNIIMGDGNNSSFCCTDCNNSW